VANAVGVRRGRPEGLLERLCRAYVQRAAEPLSDVERHVMCLHAEGPRRPRRGGSVNAPPLPTKYGFNFGTGVVCGFLSEYYAYGQPPNPVVAARPA